MSRARPERRRRGDIVAAVALVFVLLTVAGTYWWNSRAAATTSVTAASPVPAPPGTDRVPPGFVLAWRAPSGATAAPVVAGPAVVTADGSAVVGHEARTGVPAWSYSRDLPLCTAAAGFPDADGGIGRAFALYRDDVDGEWCSELTSLRPDTGARAEQRNPDARPGTRFLADGELVALTGADHAEVLRAPDLVRTLEYGAVPTPEQPDQQPRPGCTYGSFAFAAERLAVVERCPNEPVDRLTVLRAVPENPERPQEEFSVPLPGTGAVLVVLTAARAAVVLPAPARLLVLDETGATAVTAPLDVPGLASDPPGGVAPVSRDQERFYWWTGARTLALDASTLQPAWSLGGTLGAGTPYGGALLVPVPEGLAEVDPPTGAVRRTIEVARQDRTAPVVLAAHGEMLLEQRGPELVALRPWG